MPGFIQGHNSVSWQVPGAAPVFFKDQRLAQIATGNQHIGGRTTGKM